MADINTLNWPPYGAMAANLQQQAANTPVPHDFRVGGQPATAADYTQFIKREALEMADWLWPVYDRASRGWQGSACASAEALTLADLDLMKALRPHLKREAMCLNRGLNKTHEQLFHLEDESARPTLEIYLPPLPAPLLADVRAGIDDSLRRGGPTHLRLKEHFQRPRALLVSYLLGRPFEYEFAKTAFSPAMISGHCFQGLAGRCGGYLATRAMLEAVPEAVESLQQYCVDIGDHRVFAGVHYPSDNISSWYVCLRLCDHAFGQDGPVAKKFMWDSITKRSIVYDAIVTAAQSNNSPYRGPLQKLQAEAARAVGG